MASRKLIVEIVGDARSLERALSQSTRSAKTFGSTLSRALRGAAIAGGTLGFGALAISLKAGVKEFEETQRAAAQTAAVLKSTGGQAGITAAHIDRLANSILRTTGIDDEAVKSVENLLLGFTNLRNEAGKGNDVFDRATRSILDFSARTGRNATSAAIQFGRALTDPYKNLSALTRLGVTFTKAQKDQIAGFAKANDLLGEQRVVLDEVAKRFGGAAEAAGTTLSGKLNILRETLKNVSGEIVGRLAPAITRLLDRLNLWLSDSDNVAKIQKTVASTAHALSEAVKGLVAVFNALRGPVGFVVDALGGLKRTIELLAIVTLTRRLVGLAAAFRSVAAAETLAGTQATIMGGKVKALSLLKIAIPVTIAFAAGEAGKQLDKFLHERFPGVFGADIGTVTKKDTLGAVKSASTTSQLEKLAKSLKDARAIGLPKDVFDTTMAAIAAKLKQLQSPGRGNAALGAAGFGEITIRNVIQLDGRQNEVSVTKRQQVRTRRNPPRRRG